MARAKTKRGYTAWALGWLGTQLLPQSRGSSSWFEIHDFQSGLRFVARSPTHFRDVLHLICGSGCPIPLWQENRVQQGSCQYMPFSDNTETGNMPNNVQWGGTQHFNIIVNNFSLQHCLYLNIDYSQRYIQTHKNLKVGRGHTFLTTFMLWNVFENHTKCIECS